LSADWMAAFFQALLSRAAGPALRALLSARTAILMFHGLTDREHTGCENGQHKHLHVDKFEEFLKFLTRHYRIVALEEVVGCLQRGQTPPRRGVVLTFDDGFLSNHQLAFPLLKRHGAPAMVFLATEYVDERRLIWTDRVDQFCHAAGKSVAELRAIKFRLKKLPQEEIEAAVSALESGSGTLPSRSDDPRVAPIHRSLGWEEVREMQASGLVTFGAHTHTHKILGRCRQETIKSELSRSKSLIEHETGRLCEHFCYPNGGVGDFTEESEQLCKEAGFASTLTTIPGWVREGMAPYLLPRFGVSNDLDVERLSLILTGVQSMVEKARGGWRRSA
jgi:peptidoglycan/xylan/chitin deacetylase (PgdA/CDA1 family)